MRKDKVKGLAYQLKWQSSNCNVALGMFKNDIGLMAKAIQYLEQHKIMQPIVISTN